MAIRSIILTAAIAAGTILASPSATASEKLKVVASFSILADFVEQVGSDNVTVVTLVKADGDAHVYEPTPADVGNVAKAQVIIVNGLGLEGWMSRLVEASGTKAPVTEASHGVVAISGEDQHGASDPHAFQDIGNAVIYVKNIADALCTARPEDCGAFRQNAENYTSELTALQGEVKALVASIPKDRRTIITSHDAFGYFANAYGINFLAPEGVSTDAEASAGGVARLIEQIKQQKASALFVENITDPRLINQIARETGIRVSGVLYSDALSAADGPAATYTQMIRHNVGTILAAIRQGS